MNTSKKIVIVGGSGFIGTKLTEALVAKKYVVTIVDVLAPRTQIPGVDFVKINLAVDHPNKDVFENCYGIINLAGATIGKRWNEAYKKLIYSSRIDTTQAIVDTISRLSVKPSVLLSASASGYYGDQKEELLAESHPPGNDFLAHVCIDWESKALQAEKSGLRVVLIRTANVLGPGGLLASLEPLFKKGLGGYFGSGKQCMPWVHWKDIVNIYIFALEHELQGAYNVGAGSTISQKELFTYFKQAIHAAFIWPVPLFAARIILGDFAYALVASQNTHSQKIQDAGYRYVFHDIISALHDMYPS